MMLRSGAPIFSKMNGLSLPLMRLLSSPWVSLSRNLFESVFSLCTLSSIVPSSRNWLRFLCVTITVLANLTRLSTSLMALLRISIN